MIFEYFKYFARNEGQDLITFFKFYDFLQLFTPFILFYMNALFGSQNSDKNGVYEFTKGRFTISNNSNSFDKSS